MARRNKTTRILVADDHPVVRKGIVACLKKEPSFEVIGEARDGMEATRQVKALQPDVILLDLDMPGMTGFAVAEALRDCKSPTKTLILTVHAQPDYVLRMVEAGVRGYVLKDAAPDELIRAIAAVDGGETYFSPEVARVALNRLLSKQSDCLPGFELTPRERDVLIHIAEGLSNKEIACRLNVGVRTVETHRERIMRKLNIHTVAGLTKYAIHANLVRVD